MGNRTYKKVDYPTSGLSDGDIKTHETHYIRDAQGNTLSIYEKKDKFVQDFVIEGEITLSEQPIYGSSRIGVYNAQTEKFHRSLGHKNYELSNHLGNVLTVISDNKIADDVSAGLATSYKARVISQSDYYPFGLEMKGRAFSAGSEGYRFGFNGMEKEKALGGKTDFGARLYDAAVGRWWSVDPLAAKLPNLTPYNFVANSPLLFVDPDGKILEINGVTEEAKQLIEQKLSVLSKYSRRARRVIRKLKESKNVHRISAIVDFSLVKEEPKEAYPTLDFAKTLPFYARQLWVAKINNVSNENIVVSYFGLKNFSRKALVVSNATDNRYASNDYSGNGDASDYDGTGTGSEMIIRVDDVDYDLVNVDDAMLGTLAHELKHMLDNDRGLMKEHETIILQKYANVDASRCYSETRASIFSKKVARQMNRSVKKARRKGSSIPFDNVIPDDYGKFNKKEARKIRRETKRS